MIDLHLSVFLGRDGAAAPRVPLAVGQTLVFGRSPHLTDVCLPQIAINRRHFEVGRDEAGAWVKDLDSRSGTWVNGAPIQRAGWVNWVWFGTGEATHRLRLDDVIRVCDAWVRLGARVPVDPAWLAWNDGTVAKIAQVIYQDRAFDRLPILADALEDAGCDQAELLNHLRGPGPHARGCWAVDLLLGKE